MNDVYVLMNDYTQPNIPFNLTCNIDVVKDNSSEHYFPEYVMDPECPNQLYLIYDDKKKYLNFDYFLRGRIHLLSTRLLKLIKGLKAAPLIEKELIPIMEKTGEIITTERYYHLLYFTPIKVVDEEQSIFEETNMGPRPVKFVLNEYISKYDVMEIDNASVGENLETFIGGHIIGNSSFKEQVEAADLVGIKIVPLDEAFEHFRRDHSHFNITPVVKRPRPKLP